MADFIEFQFDDSQMKKLMKSMGINWSAFKGNRSISTLSGKVGFLPKGAGTILTTGIQVGTGGAGNVVESKITNRQKHAVIAEFGSGIYSEGPGGKQAPITPRSAGALIIPVSTVYQDKLSSDVISEALNNAQKHPDILSKIKGQFPGIFGFIFRDSIKGMKPIRMVRDSIPLAEAAIQQELITLLQAGQPDRAGIAKAVNIATVAWFREIVRRSPVLTSNMKTGWTISKIAQ